MADNPLYSFMHIQKTGGTTLETVLRRHFGLRHLDVAPRRGWLYTYRDLRADMRLNPFLRSLAGHWLRPCIDYGKYGDRMVWFTMLRDPIKRYISHYQHLAERRGLEQTFEEFFDRARTQNLHVRLLTAGQDLEKAKDMLASFRCVCLLERFDESLLLLRSRLGLDDMKIVYQRRNEKRSEEMRERVKADAERLADQVADRNALDLELYAYAEKLFEKQIDEYGRDHLAADLETAQAEHAGLRENVGERTNDWVRKGIYRPIVKTRGWIARMNGMPDTRC